MICRGRVEKRGKGRFGQFFEHRGRAIDGFHSGAESVRVSVEVARWGQDR